MQEIVLEVIEKHIPLNKEKSISSLHRFLSLWYGVTSREYIKEFSYSLNNNTKDSYYCKIDYTLHDKEMELYIKIIDQNGIESTMTYKGPQFFIKGIAGNIFDHLFH